MSDKRNFMIYVCCGNFCGMVTIMTSMDVIKKIGFFGFPDFCDDDFISKCYPVSNVTISARVVDDSVCINDILIIALKYDSADKTDDFMSVKLFIESIFCYIKQDSCSLRDKVAKALDDRPILSNRDPSGSDLFSEARREGERDMLKFVLDLIDNSDD